MTLKTVTRAAGVVFALTAMSAAHAATVENLGGVLRVNQGKGYIALQGTGMVKPGDTIMADLKGKGRVVYGDGCSVNVKPGQIVTVAEVSPCSLTAQAPDNRSGDVTAPPIDPALGLLTAAGVAAAGATAASLAIGSGNGGGGFTPFITPPRPASP